MSYDEAVLKYQPQTREEAYEIGLANGIALAIQMLQDYAPESEEVTRCMHSDIWAAWLKDKTSQIKRGAE